MNYVTNFKFDLVSTKDSRMSNQEIKGEYFVYSPDKSTFIIGQLESIDSNNIAKLICKNYNNFNHLLHIPFSRLNYLRGIGKCYCEVKDSLDNYKTNSKKDCLFCFDDNCIKKPVLDIINHITQCILCDLKLIPIRGYKYDSTLYFENRELTNIVKDYYETFLSGTIDLHYASWMYSIISNNVLPIRQIESENQLKLF